MQAQKSQDEWKRHVTKVIDSLKKFYADFGLVNYTGETGEPIQRIEPFEPNDLFFQQSAKKHLHEYDEIWRSWERAKTTAKINLDAIEDAYNDYEKILVGMLKAAKITLLPAKQFEATPYYKPKSFRLLLLQNLRQKVIFGKVVSDPLSEPWGERFKVTWDNEIIAGGPESQSKALANLGAELLKSDDLGNIVRRISQTTDTHEQLRSSASQNLRKMVDDQIIFPVEAEYQELRGKGKCYACATRPSS